MATKSTILKANIQISHIDENYYDQISLVLALHPSETEERLMVRIVAFVLNLSESQKRENEAEDLIFSRGLSNDEEPAIWQKKYNDEIALWIDVGLPEEKRVRKASAKAKQVKLYCYGDNALDIWWNQNKDRLKRFSNLQVFRFAKGQTEGLKVFAGKNMDLQFTIDEQGILVSNEDRSHQIEIESLLG